MKIVVCVKCVPDGRARLDPATARIDRRGAMDVNAFDLYAVEVAVRAKEERGAEVVVVSVGPAGAAEALRTPLALGADRAVLVSDDAAAGSDLLGTARIVAALLGREGPDLVLFGQQTSDGGGALLWSAVGEWTRLPVVSQVTALELGEDAVRATRQTEAGDEVVEAPLPALVAVTDAVAELRYASLKGMMGAKRKALEVLGLADLGVAASAVGGAGARTEVLRIGPPPTRPAAVRVDDGDDAAAAVVDFLAGRALL